MNIEQARSFLTVADTGSFVAAAERLHVTQSTISARIRALEETLGCVLFVRNKTGASLTGAGVRFQTHALQMVRAFERARRETGLPDTIRAQVAIGARFGLWDSLAVQWLAQQRKDRPDVSFRAEIAFEPELMQGLIEGHLDIGIMYTPQHRPKLEIRPFMTERLRLVSSERNASLTPDSYIHIEWGPEFDAQLASGFPEFYRTRLSFNIGWLGVRFLKTAPACAYFPEQFVRRELDAGVFHVVDDAPAFDLPSSLVLRDDRDRSLVDPMVESLLDLVRSR